MARKQATIATDDDLEKTFTDSTIKAAIRSGKSSCETAAVGLYLLVHNKKKQGVRDSHRWVFRYPYPGKPGKTRELALGTYVAEGEEASGVSLKLARKEARKYRDLLAEGKDPAEIRAAGKQKSADDAEDARRVAAGEPARDSFKQYAEEYAAKKRAGDLAGIGEDDGDDKKPRRRTKWGDKSYNDFLRSMKADVFIKDGGIGNMNVRTIETDHCYQVLARIEARGALSQMSTVRDWMFNIFEMVRKRKIIAENPVEFLDDDTLAEHIAGKHPAVKNARELRDVLLKFDEHAARELDVGMRKSTYDAMARAVALQVLLFQRPHMIMQMRKEWIDWTGERADVDDEDGGPVLYYPFAEMKLKPKERAERPEFHEIPLSVQAQAILREQIASAGDSPFVFPGLGDDQKSMAPASLNDRIQRALGRVGRDKAWITYQDAHGFRAVARTFGPDYVGLTEKAIESLLAHATGDKELRKTYSRSEYIHLRRDAMQRWANWIDDVRAGKKHALTLPKSALSETMQNQIDAAAYREMERSGELAQFRAWQGTQMSTPHAAASAPIIREGETTAANMPRHAA